MRNIFAGLKKSWKAQWHRTRALVGEKLAKVVPIAWAKDEEFDYPNYYKKRTYHPYYYVHFSREPSKIGLFFGLEEETPIQKIWREIGPKIDSDWAHVFPLNVGSLAQVTDPQKFEKIYKKWDLDLKNNYTIKLKNIIEGFNKKAKSRYRIELHPDSRYGVRQDYIEENVLLDDPLMRNFVKDVTLLYYQYKKAEELLKFTKYKLEKQFGE